MSSHDYHMLICSLPPLPVRLAADRLPISAETLDDRLRMLAPKDAEELARMAAVLQWSRQFGEADDAAVVKEYDASMQRITTPLVREVLGIVIDLRVITSALRRRRRGLGPPPVGMGRWFEHIRRHFTEPDFGLGRVLPRFAQLAPLFEQGEVLQLHRGLLKATWELLRKRADDYFFSFEAVVLYVVRWHLLRHSLELSVERGRPVFEALVTEALGEYANVYP